MKTIRTTELVGCVLLLCGVAAAQTVTVQQVMDHRHTVHDYSSENSGVWFIPPEPPGHICDHWPFYRASTQDWGWTHDVTGLVPPDANGIESASLTIVAWGVKSPDEGEYPEQDVIYADGINLGLLSSYTETPITFPDWPSEGQVLHYNTMWSTTTFTLPPEVLDTLWMNRQLYMWLDINKLLLGGFRVTLKSSKLTIRYYGPEGSSGGGGTTEVLPVHRFWSPIYSGHFYTVGEEEKQGLIDNYPHIWTYEDVGYRALADGADPDAVPVHRFWSPIYSGHFYTSKEAEKQKLVENFRRAWTYEGIVFYVYTEDNRPAETVPVHRFWSESLGRHFYTTSEAEKQMLVDDYPHVWTYEETAWYAYAP